MSSRSRNFRRRGGDDNEDDDDTKPTKSTTTANGGPSSTTASAAAKPKNPSTQTPKSLLSFADDADESPFTRPPSSSSSRASSTIKPSSSHKLTSAKDRIAPARPSKLSNVQPQAGTYTKEALLELQKNTKTLSGPRPAHSKPKKEAEPVIVLKGLIKPVGSADQDVDNEEKVEKSDDEEDDKLGSEKKRDETTARFRSMGLRGKGEDIGSGIIPDQATIDAIRAKRERLRQSRAAAPDFIALDSGSNHGEAEGLSDEEPEFQGRIGFFGDKIESGKKGVFEDFDDRAMPKAAGAGAAAGVGVGSGDGDDEDEDEEDKMWEEEQVRKGLGKRMDDGATRGVSSASVSSSSVAQSVQQQKFVYSGTGASVYPSSPGVSVAAAASTTAAAGPNIGGAVGGLPGFDSMSIAQQAELAKKALHENLRRLKETHGRTMASLTKTDENLSASLTNVTVLEKSLTAAGEKYIFMQKLRDFVSVICEFLQDRAPYIEEVEAQLQKLHEERAVAILERRAADKDDEMKEIEAAVNAAMSVLSKGGSSTAMLEAATNAAQAAAIAAKELRDLPVELDEFGRDVNLQKRMDMNRRAEARQRRRAKSDANRLSSSVRDRSYQRIEGESSTDESDSESTAYQSNRDQLLQIADQILGKADEEFAQLSSVIERIERWKKEYASTYRDAYMSLSAPAIFSPYVRLELLKWDPLHEDADFIDMKWHSLLFNYGLPEDDSKISADDADANLVPELVEKLAIPILHHQLAYCWDMLSTRETEYAVSATNLVFRYVPLTSSALAKLVAVLRDRLSEAVDNLTIPTWNTLVMNVVPNAARVAAYRFGMSIRLMRNICLWNKILAMPVLEKLVLDELLSGKILPHMRSIQSNIHDAVTRSERIIASLHGVWTGPSIAGDRCPKLQPLVDYLLALGRALEKKHVSGGTDTETGKLARRLKKMLVDLNEYDHARAMSRTFNLKEAL